MWVVTEIVSTAEGGQTHVYQQFRTVHTYKWNCVTERRVLCVSNSGLSSKSCIQQLWLGHTISENLNTSLINQAVVGWEKAHNDSLEGFSHDTVQAKAQPNSFPVACIFAAKTVMV